MKYFTKAQIEEIRKALAMLGVRDTDLPDADVVDGDELVAIVQDGVNRKISISELFLNFSDPSVLENIVRGADGKSAYEIWKEQPGNDGKSVAQFLASLKGEDGTPGTNGTNGTNGVNGTSAGFGTPTASVGTDDSGQPKCVITASGPDTAKIFNFAFKNIGSGGGGGESDDDDQPGEPGRSMTSADLWFKLSSLGSNVNPPELSIENPASAAGGSWSKTSSNPTEQQPYLWCFMQFNYDKPLDNGKYYNRSGSWISRRYNSDTSTEYNDLVTMINGVADELRASISQYASDLTDIYNVLQGVQNQLSGEIKNRLDGLNSRLALIEGTDVTEIAQRGLWGMLTSYTESGKKAFSDLVLDATRANAMISTGSAFFNGKNAQQISANLNIDGLDARISACATRQDLDAILASGLSIEASAIKALISKAHSCWKKDGVIYRYDLYWDEFWGSGESGSGESDETEINFFEYEEYMESSPASGGPTGDGTTAHPAGPFELVITVDEFSYIKQTSDSIAASVYGYEYMWKKTATGEIAAYDAFSDEYDESGSLLDYETYVGNKGYVKIKTSTVLSNITQTSTEIKSMVGKVNKFWKKGGQYQEYEFPADGDVATYEATMVAAGWTLEEYIDRMSVIDQTGDKIELAVIRANSYWVSTTLTSGEWYCVPYDTWYDDYLTAVEGGYSGTYVQWVGANHSAYQLKNIDDAITQIKQNADNISLSAAKIGALETNVGTLQVSANEIKMGVGVVLKVWVNSSGDIKNYYAFKSEWDDIPQPKLAYDNWVPLRKGYTLTELDPATLAGIQITTDKIWQGVGDGQGNVAASIEVIKDMAATRLWKKNGQTFKYNAFYTEFGEYAEVDGTMTYQEWMAYNGYTLQSGSAIVLTADNVYVDGTLISPIANLAGFKFKNERIESQSLDSSDNPNIIIDGNNGTLTANDATIRGHIDATSGTIGPLDIAPSSLTGTYVEGSASSVDHLESYIAMSKTQFQVSTVTGSREADPTSSGKFSISSDPQGRTGYVQIEGYDNRASGFDYLLYVNGSAKFAGEIEADKLVAREFYSKNPVRIITGSDFDGVGNYQIGSAYSGVHYIFGYQSVGGAATLPNFTASDTDKVGFYFDVTVIDNYHPNPQQSRTITILYPNQNTKIMAVGNGDVNTLSYGTSAYFTYGYTFRCVFTIQDGYPTWIKMNYGG